MMSSDIIPLNSLKFVRMNSIFSPFISNHVMMTNGVMISRLMPLPECDSADVMMILFSSSLLPSLMSSCLIFCVWIVTFDGLDMISLRLFELLLLSRSLYCFFGIITMIFLSLYPILLGALDIKPSPYLVALVRYG